MATKVTDLTELTSTPANGDYIHVIDVSDTTGGTAGTSKKVTISRLPSGGGGGTSTITVRNDTGSTITAGTAVYITGVVSSTPTIAAADNSSSSTMPAAGIVQSDISNNTDGDLITYGEVQSLDTSGFTASDTLYVGTSGALTNTRPSGTALVQNIGTCLKVSASTGSIIVQGAGRSNDVPNLPNGQVFVGNASGVAVAREFDVADLGDVNASSPSQGQNLSYNTSGNWVLDSRTTTLYANLKEGTSTTINDGAGATSKMELTGTTAELKTGVTGLKITETSPGDVEFDVATDSTGSTTFTAIHLDGSTTANQADLIIKLGCYLKLEDGSYTQWIKPSSGTTRDTTITLPDDTGQLALTSEIPTNVVDLADVTSAGSGAIITTAERTKLAGIATGAEVNAVDSVNTQTGAVVLDTDDISEGSANLYYTEARVSANSSVTANTAKTSFPGFGTTSGTALEGDTLVVLSINNEFPDASGDVALDLSSVTTGGSNLGGDIDLNGHNIIYPKTGNTDHSHNGDIIKIGTGSTVQGELCYLTSSGTWVATDADAVATSGGVLLAIALGTDPDADGMLLRGMYTLDYDSGTIGDVLYVSTTAGELTSTAPTGAGDVVRVVGYCLDSTNGQIYFNPSNDWIELS